MQIFLFKFDILIVTTGTKKDHLVKERDVLWTLDYVKLQLKAVNCKNAKKGTEWLVFKCIAKELRQCIQKWKA